jgi:hypothetical protein
MNTKTLYDSPSMNQARRWHLHLDEQISRPKASELLVRPVFLPNLFGSLRSSMFLFIEQNEFSICRLLSGGKQNVGLNELDSYTLSGYASALTTV